jgi:DNA-binding winged helix-turn-helix (wHTH) protein/tetratricopeptide (TPR) repeat protein
MYCTGASASEPSAYRRDGRPAEAPRSGDFALGGLPRRRCAFILAGESPRDVRGAIPAVDASGAAPSARSIFANEPMDPSEFSHPPHIDVPRAPDEVPPSEAVDVKSGRAVRLFDSQDVTIDPGARELKHRGRLVVLAPPVFDCIAYLLANRERAVGRDELVAGVWGRVEIADATVHQTVMKARRALGDSGEEQRTIRTVPRFGYRWIAPVETLAAPSPTIRREACTAEPAAAQRNAEAPGVVRMPRAIPIGVAVLVAWIFASIVWLLGSRELPKPSTPASVDSAALVVLRDPVAPGAHTAWIPLGVMDAIGSYLRDGGEAVVPSRIVIGLFDDSNGHEPDIGRWRDATGATRIVRSDARRNGERWIVALALEGAGPEPVRTEGEAGDVVAAARTASRRLIERLHPDARTGSGSNETDEPALLLQRARAELLANRIDVAAAVLDGAPATTKAKTEVRLLRAEVDYRAGRLDAARTAYEALLSALSGESEPLQRAQVLIALGSIARTSADFVEAERVYAQAIALLAPLHDAIALGRAHLYRGTALGSLSRFDEARTEIALARVLLGGAGDAQGVASADAAMATVDADRGRLSEASRNLERAIDRLERLGEHAAALDLRIALAQMRTEMLEHETALDESRLAWREIGGQTGHRLYVMAGSVHARALAAVGCFEEAGRVLARVENMATDRTYQWRYERTVAAQLAMRSGHPDRAERIAAEIAMAEGIETETDLGPLLVVWTRAIRVRGDTEAVRAADARIAIWSARNAEGSSDEGVYAALIEAERLRAGNDRGGSDRAYQTALARASRLGVPMHLVAVVLSYAEALIAEGALDDAAAIVGQVSAMAASDFDCALLTARLHQALGNRDAWRDAVAHARALAGERRMPPAIGRFEIEAPKID